MHRETTSVAARTSSCPSKHTATHSIIMRHNTPQHSTPQQQAVAADGGAPADLCPPHDGPRASCPVPWHSQQGWTSRRVRSRATCPPVPAQVWVSFRSPDSMHIRPVGWVGWEGAVTLSRSSHRVVTRRGKPARRHHWQARLPCAVADDAQLGACHLPSAQGLTADQPERRLPPPVRRIRQRPAAPVTPWPRATCPPSHRTSSQQSAGGNHPDGAGESQRAHRRRRASGPASAACDSGALRPPCARMCA